jgi:hypothetical protein
MFSPNPTAVAHYTDSWVVALMVLCLALIVGSFFITRWRKTVLSGVMRKLSASWSSMAFWMGIVGLVLVVARVEKIQIIAMPFLWVVWGAVILLYVIIQWRLFSMKHYEVMPRNVAVDPRDQYLPKRKK